MCVCERARVCIWPGSRPKEAETGEEMGERGVRGGGGGGGGKGE